MERRSEETVTVATEGSVSSNKREVFYRVVGDESKERSKVKGDAALAPFTS